VYRNLGGTKGRMVRAGNYIFYYGTGNRIFAHHRIVSAVNRVQFVSGRM
jgi:hypothetical protein